MNTSTMTPPLPHTAQHQVHTAHNYVYLLACADGTIYSGWTTDITRRMTAHNAGTAGAKYTKSRRPVTLIHCEAYPTRSEAMRREAALKRLSHAEKCALAAQSARPDRECLTVYDSRMQPCGVLERALVHRFGLRHRVVHVLVREVRDGVSGIWLQQRGFDRPLLPGAFDWTATGHVDPGEALCDAAARELREESGLVLPADALQQITEFHHKTVRKVDFLDDEVTTSFAWYTDAPPSFTAGPEVACLVWVSDAELTQAIVKHTPFSAVLTDGTVRTIAAEQLCCTLSEWKRVLQHPNAS